MQNSDFVVLQSLLFGIVSIVIGVVITYSNYKDSKNRKQWQVDFLNGKSEINNYLFFPFGIILIVLSIIL